MKNHFKIILPYSKTRLRKQFPLLRYIQLWNTLKTKPIDMSSLAAFKRFVFENVLESQA